MCSGRLPSSDGARLDAVQRHAEHCSVFKHFSPTSHAGAGRERALLFQPSFLVLGLSLGYRLCKQRECLPLAAPGILWPCAPVGRTAFPPGEGTGQPGEVQELCAMHQTQYYSPSVQGVLTSLLTSHASKARVVFSTVMHLAVAMLTSWKIETKCKFRDKFPRKRGGCYTAVNLMGLQDTD